jgi:peptidoglycan/LPS O-acetylase OafA/YrhL
MRGGVGSRLVAPLAAWSYSIYLVHFPLLLVMLQHWPAATPVASALRTGTWLAATLALSAFVHRTWEMPMMRKRPPLAKPGARLPWG